MIWLWIYEHSYLSLIGKAITGKGGFGRVVLCKNKLDERQYAIKRVSVNDNNGDLSTMFREVATLSRFQHQYIVHYYQLRV
ncbi:eIF-2-alpha kinase GCN2-like [Rutidosis leptorrhynchoides]|uniref:eIF-2-alpha kinase GCN2-like n=1 Tax=Rutidosis leptorrhynchoides TaxID=125765 RepID=UPI003A993A8D